MSKKLLKSTAIVSAMTLPSRILGFVRDMVVAVTFGASGATDAFLVAFRIPNLLRRMFAEGAFAQAFVPVFTEYRETRSREALKDLADYVSGALLLVLTLITVIGVIAAPWIITLFAPGFSDEPDKQQLAAEMLRLTFPYLLFISMTALAGGILNSFGHFAVPALTPVFLNLVLIAAALWLAPMMAEPITALAWGVFIAGAVQLAFQIPALWKIGLVPKPSFRRGHEGVKRVTKLMLPALLGSSVAQINMLFNTLLASFLMTGSIAWLYFSDRFVELPLALFGIALGTVILPRLSAEHANQSGQAFSDTLDWALKLGLMVALPAMLGLMLLSGPILATLLQYNSFTAYDTKMASISLSVFALGLPGFALVKILAPGFFARQDTVTPVKIAVISILANILLYLLVFLPWFLFDGPAPHAALAFCTAMASVVNASLLYRKLRKDKVYIPRPGWSPLLVKIIIALVAMGVAIYVVRPPLEQWQDWSVIQRSLRLGGLILIGVVTYPLSLWLLGIRPAQLINRNI